MQLEVRTKLLDIQAAIQEIKVYVGGTNNVEDFKSDLKTRRAVERCIEIIGEAMAGILRIDPNLTITDSRRIVGTRNRIIHGYDSVSEEILWKIVMESLPKLEREVEMLLG